jgi:hypothetical protein
VERPPWAPAEADLGHPGVAGYSSRGRHDSAADRTTAPATPHRGDLRDDVRDVAGAVGTTGRDAHPGSARADRTP